MMAGFDWGGAALNFFSPVTAAFGIGPAGQWWNSTTDQAKLNDQAAMRGIGGQLQGPGQYDGMIASLAQSILSGNSNASIGLQGQGAMRDLSAQLASRGLGNSGVAGSAYGSLFASLLGQRDADKLNRQQSAAGLYGNLGQMQTNRLLGAAGVYQGIGERPASQGEAVLGAAGYVAGQALPYLFGGFGK
jgi:hypothetical protein